jgi:hypothetical protein
MTAKQINNTEELQYLHHDQATSFSDRLRHARPGVALAKNLRWAVTFGTIISLLLAGCGDDSSGLSRSPLDAQADSICQQGTAEIKAAGPIPDDFEASSIVAAGYLDRVVPISDKTVAQLSTLEPNGSVKEEWNQFMVSIRAAATALDAARTKAHSGDPSGLQDFAQATGPLTQTLDAAARRVGAVGCAN